MDPVPTLRRLTPVERGELMRERAERVANGIGPIYPTPLNQVGWTSGLIGAVREGIALARRTGRLACPVVQPSGEWDVVLASTPHGMEERVLLIAPDDPRVTVERLLGTALQARGIDEPAAWTIAAGWDQGPLPTDSRPVEGGKATGQKAVETQTRFGFG